MAVSAVQVLPPKLDGVFNFKKEFVCTSVQALSCSCRGRQGGSLDKDCSPNDGIEILQHAMQYQQGIEQ